jgi:hypothetical protein
MREAHCGSAPTMGRVPGMGDLQITFTYATLIVPSAEMSSYKCLTQFNSPFIYTRVMVQRTKRGLPLVFKLFKSLSNFDDFTSALRELVFKFIDKRFENFFVTNYLCANYIFFWLEIFVQLPDFGKSNPSDSIPASYKNFINTKSRRNLIKALIDSIENRYTLLVKKTKGLGATTSMLLTALWYTGFRNNARFVYVCPAYNSKKFSSGTKSVFYTLYHLWKKYYTVGYNFDFIRQHYNHPIRYFSLANPKRNSALIIVTGNKPINLAELFPENENLEYKVVMFDEFAFHKEADALWDALEYTDITKIALSSPNGKNNLFYDLINSANYKIHTMHWYHEPQYTESWYQQICQNNDPTWVEQYINLDFNYKYTPPTTPRPPTKNELFIQQLLEKSKFFRDHYKPKKTLRNTKKNIPDIKTTIDSDVSTLEPPRRKRHQNPKNITTPSTYTAALAKFAKAHNPHIQQLTEKTTNAMKKFRVKLSLREPGIVESLPIVITMLYGPGYIEKLEAGLIEPKQSISRIFSLPTPQKVATFIHKLRPNKHRVA